METIWVCAVVSGMINRRKRHSAGWCAQRVKHFHDGGQWTVFLIFGLTIPVKRRRSPYPGNFLWIFLIVTTREHYTFTMPVVWTFDQHRIRVNFATFVWAVIDHMLFYVYRHPTYSSTVSLEGPGHHIDVRMCHMQCIQDRLEENARASRGIGSQQDRYVVVFNIAQPINWV